MADPENFGGGGNEKIISTNCVLSQNLGCLLFVFRVRVEDTRLETKKTKKIRGKEQPFQGQTLSGPRTGMLEAKDQRHNAKVISKKKVFTPKICESSGNFWRSPKKKVSAPRIQECSAGKK